MPSNLPRKDATFSMTKVSNKFLIPLILLLIALASQNAAADEEFQRPYTKQIEATLKQNWKAPKELNMWMVLNVPVRIDAQGNPHVSGDAQYIDGTMAPKEVTAAVEKLKFAPPSSETEMEEDYTFTFGFNTVKVFEDQDSRPADPERVQKLQDLEDTLNATADTLDRMGATVSLYDMFKEKFLQVVFFIIVPVIAIYQDCAKTRLPQSCKIHPALFWGTPICPIRNVTSTDFSSISTTLTSARTICRLVSQSRPAASLVEIRERNSSN
jgi:hypothetical protein